VTPIVGMSVLHTPYRGNNENESYLAKGLRFKIKRKEGGLGVAHARREEKIEIETASLIRNANDKLTISADKPVDLAEQTFGFSGFLIRYFCGFLRFNFVFILWYSRPRCVGVSAWAMQWQKAKT